MSYLRLESGGRLLQQNGYGILLETGAPVSIDQLPIGHSRWPHKELQQGLSRQEREKIRRMDERRRKRWANEPEIEPEEPLPEIPSTEPLYVATEKSIEDLVANPLDKLAKSLLSTHARTHAELERQALLEEDHRVRHQIAPAFHEFLRLSRERHGDREDRVELEAQTLLEQLNRVLRRPRRLKRSESGAVQGIE